MSPYKKSSLKLAVVIVLKLVSEPSLITKGYIKPVSTALLDGNSKSIGPTYLPVSEAVLSTLSSYRFA